MYAIVLVIFVLTLFAIILAPDSFLNREYRIYQTLVNRSYLTRPQILATYDTFH